MIVEVSPAYHGTLGIHSEWKARDLRITDLGNHVQRVDLIFRDDGPNRGGNRHPDVPYSIVFDARTDWEVERIKAWRKLEEMKKGGN